MGAKLFGDKQMARNFAKLGRRVQGRIARSSSSKSMTPVNKAAKKNLRQNGSIESGALVRSIGKKIKQYRKGGTTTVNIGPRVGSQFDVTWKGRIRKPKKYAHLVELGTWQSRAKPFIRPALESNESVVLGILGSDMGVKIEKEARSMPK